MRAPLLALLVLAACAAEEDATLSGTIEFPDVEVGSLVGGRVLEVKKREGETAQEDDVLVELDPGEWRSALAEAEALAEATEKDLDLLIAGPRAEEVARAEAEAKRLELLWKVVALGAREEEIEGAREDVRAAQALEVEAERQLAREKDLAKSGSSTKEALDKATATAETARARRAAADQRLRLLERGARPEEVEASRQAYLAQEKLVEELKAGARPEEIASKRAQLDAARARIATAKEKIDELTIRAPAPCIVQTLDLRPGDLIAPGAPVAVVLLLEEPWVLVHVPESRLAAIAVGQRAEIRPDGHPPIEGSVEWVSREAEYTPRNVQTREERVTQVFRAKVRIVGDASRLKDGMWADVELR
ncbi:MAG TPA: HlyD family efflux transporter periplasmic adaptor subunit [Planctomycetota bacterium]|nr:HlyD family efflux transporter periplasmic adaptor subunit [Planctomycetota bacterium]